MVHAFDEVRALAPIHPWAAQLAAEVAQLKAQLAKKDGVIVESAQKGTQRKRAWAGSTLDGTSRAIVHWSVREAMTEIDVG